MSRGRRFAGVWIALIVLGLFFPAIFVRLSEWLDGELGFRALAENPFLVIAAGFFVFAGAFWVLWAYSYLHFVGRGSPIEAFGRELYATEDLVTTGPYAYTRNPMLLGYLFILLGIALYLNSISGLILTPLLAILGMLYYYRWEEPVLARRFPKSYGDYRRRVPALFPWLRTPA